MSELEVFAAALQITDASQRSEHLDRVCGTDGALRNRLDVLLENHKVAGSFLESPASPQLAAALLAEQDRTQAEPGDDETDHHVLAFLQPSTRPSALGRLEHYEVLEVLGQGGFGTVVRAFDEKLHRMVAIKIMSRQLAATSPARKRFIREARSSAAIRHENVVAIHAIEEQPLPFLVMEYVAGETLQQRLDRTGPLDPVDVLLIGVQIAHGLVAAHAMGKVHRDIKPANILLENGVDRVKITDFGLARAADDASLTQSGVIAGTPMYMAPEQAQCVALDHRADLFSLGSVLYVMCSGRPPFRASTMLAVLKRVTEDAPRPIREIIPEVPEWLCDIITKLHAKNPDGRFQSAQEVAELLGRYLTELQVHGKVSQESEIKSPAAATMLLPHPAAPRKANWIGRTAAALLLLCIGLGLSEATGVTDVKGTIIRLFSPEGTLVVEVDDPDVSVTIDGEDIVIKGAGTKEIRVKPGQHKVQASKDGKVVRQELITVAKNGRQVVRISREIEPVALSPMKDKTPIKPKPLAVAPIPFVADPDRRGAEYVLSIGGSVTIQGNGAERGIYAVDELPPGAFELKGVALNQNQNVSDEGLAHLKDCRRIRAIALGSTKVSDVGLVHLKDWPLLISLDLSGTKVGDAGMAHFRSHRFLTNLSLKLTDVTDTGLAYLKNCKSLASVDLGGTNVSDSGLAQFQDCKHLARVGLAGTKVTDNGLAYFKNSPNLAALELSQTQVGDAGLAHLKVCQNLVYLDLGNSQVSATGLAHMVGYTNPLWVNVKNTKVTEAGLKAFSAALPTCMIEWDRGVIEPTVNTDPDRRAAEWLLSRPKYPPHVFAGGKETPAFRLSYLPKTPFELRRIKVDADSRLSDETLTLLKGLRHLTHLEISTCAATDAALAYFKDCKQLSELQLPGTRVTDVGLVQLAAFAKLEYLNLKQTAVTEGALKKLAAALPNCKIEWDGATIEPKHSSAMK